MNNALIIVADGGLARFYRPETTDASRAPVRLVETALLQHPDLKVRDATGRPPTETNTNRQAGPVHPMGAQRERHRVEHERRFASDIAERASEITGDWKQGVVALVADPRMLGLIRAPLHEALHEGIVLKELAKDYTKLEPAELLDRLSKSAIIAFR